MLKMLKINNLQMHLKPVCVQYVLIECSATMKTMSVFKRRIKASVIANYK